MLLGGWIKSFFNSEVVKTPNRSPWAPSNMKTQSQCAKSARVDSHPLPTSDAISFLFHLKAYSQSQLSVPGIACQISYTAVDKHLRPWWSWCPVRLDRTIPRFKPVCPFNAMNAICLTSLPNQGSRVPPKGGASNARLRVEIDALACRPAFPKELVG
jgi:hypothetical protein